MRETFSSSLLEAYERDGVAFPIPVLPPERTAALRGMFEDLEARLGGRPEPARWTNLCFPWAYELTMEPAVLDAVEQVLGPEIIVVGSIILCKHPGHEGYVAWHQDKAYAETEVVPSISAWIALADSTEANGCMRVIPGSHRELFPHHAKRDPANLIRGTRLAAAVDETQARDVKLRAGEMSLHHDRVIHGSRPNCGDDKRIGFVVRYTTPVAHSRGFPVVRARGTADCSHLVLAERPPDGEPDETLASYVRFRDAIESKLHRRAAKN